MNTRLLALSALASLLAIPAAAENYFWSFTAPNPGNWFTPGNWRVGGDSEYDPVSEAVPVAGTDTVTFRQGDSSGYRDSQGQYASRRGYMDGRYGHTDPMQDVRQMMQSADPQERERIKEQLRQMAEM